MEKPLGVLRSSSPHANRPKVKISEEKHNLKSEYQNVYISPTPSFNERQHKNMFFFILVFRLKLFAIFSRALGFGSASGSRNSSV